MNNSNIEKSGLWVSLNEIEERRLYRRELLAAPYGIAAPKNPPLFSGGR